MPWCLAGKLARVDLGQKWGSRLMTLFTDREYLPLWKDVGPW